MTKLNKILKSMKKVSKEMQGGMDFFQIKNITLLLLDKYKVEAKFLSALYIPMTNQIGELFQVCGPSCLLRLDVRRGDETPL